ncbi:uncharacterized protein MELLADRAFT_73672 [Melampsora larici-populina 98AG31]|uniref:Acyl-protein thioesterase 1 n=1 Tax=Melampsora larici-populina (strain 98AG31 / pathotype 3-4-7) TaxID=747676 RepID=F4SBJ0_MELLP|nr:uncharacterized protein MELLADRAFT_73672 [Melampsora larici-populina 98AG31]EGF97965.1 hypothetical protein MELLADRAFT_73672 [Melampsora larici-populina 98AG31]
MSYSEYKSNSLSLEIDDQSYRKPKEPELTRLMFEPTNDHQSITPMAETESHLSNSSTITKKRKQKTKYQCPFLILSLIITIIWFTTTFFESFLVLISSSLGLWNPKAFNQTGLSISYLDDPSQWTTLPIPIPSLPIHYEIIPSNSTNSSSSDQLEEKEGWTIVLLHGLGSINASDSYFIKDHLINLNPTFFKQVRFIIPFAKRVTVDVWNGVETPAWFNIHDWSDLRSGEDSIRMKENVLGLDRLVHQLGLDMSKTFFMGFSQGAVMSLLLSLNVDQPPAGVIMLSGFLPLPTQLPQMILPNRTGISSLYWLHGESDPYFPISKAQNGFESLESLKFFKSSRFQRFSKLDHRFDLLEIGFVVRWIERVVADYHR